MTPEAERVHARLLRYTVENHRADRGWLAMAAAKLIVEQAEEIERLNAALAAEAEESQPAPNGGGRNAPAASRYVNRGLRRLALQV
jgi:hypothetical protein